MTHTKFYIPVVMVMITMLSCGNNYSKNCCTPDSTQLFMEKGWKMFYRDNGKTPAANHNKAPVKNGGKSTMYNKEADGTGIYWKVRTSLM